MTQDTDVVFDREFALSQLGGNTELLAKMLDRFANDYVTMADDIEPMITNGDYSGCRAKAHTIKGVAGNLGFWNLHHHAKLLEDAAKDNEPDLSGYFDGFKISLSASIAELTSDSPAQQQESPSESTASDSDPKQELLTLLNNFEFIEPDRLDQMLSACGLDDATKASVNQAVSDLDYPTAISLLE